MSQARPYVLHLSPGTAALAVHWMLIHLGVPFEVVRLDHEAGDTRTPAFLALNPSGHVPVLVVDGEPRAEVAALLMLLAERHPEGGLDVPAGDPARADFLQTVMLLTNTLMPAFRIWFYPWEPAGPDHADAAKARARDRIEALWTRFDARFADGRTFVVGGRLTAADFLLTMLARWSRGMPRPATAWPHLKPYLDRMRALPSLRETHRREGLTDWIGG